MSSVSDLRLIIKRLWYVDLRLVTNLTDAYYGKGNVALEVIGGVKSLLGNKGQRINILKNLEGIVHNGEMLVVLGPPGR